MWDDRVKRIGAMGFDNLTALAVMLASAIAARECADRLGVNVSTEIVDDPEGATLVIMPIEKGDA